jgi:apolipoprotein N-acyltransferase
LQKARACRGPFHVLGKRYHLYIRTFSDMSFHLRAWYSALVRRVRSIVPDVIRKPFLLTSIGAMLSVTALYLPLLWWVVFVSFIPFVHAIRISSRKESVILGGLFGSILLGSATIATLWAELPEYGQSFGALTSTLLVFLSWLLFFVPLVPTVIAWAFTVSLVKNIRTASLIGLSVLWALLECSRMFIFNIATFTPQVDNPPFFSAGAVGYLLADNESWLQLASIGGVYLLSAVVVLVNLLLYLILARKNRKLLSAVVSVLVLISIFPFVAIRAVLDGQATKTVTVGVFSLYPDDVAQDNQRYESTADNSPSTTLDLVVLPEGVATSTITLFVSETHMRPDTVILSTRPQIGAGLRTNTAYIETKEDARSVPVRAKRILAAQGEYVAGLFLFFAEVFRVQPEKPIQHIYGGKWSSSFLAGTEAQVSVLFCVEVLAPGFGRQLVLSDEAQILALPMSHRQFRGAPTLKPDTLRFIKVRAVEAGVPIVASGKLTPGYAIDRYGRVIATVGNDGVTEFASVQLPFLSTDPL